MVTLNNEHRYIASLLEAMAEQADNLLPGRTPDYAMLRDIVHYMASYPDEFHHPREDIVFDRLVGRDPDSREIVEQLLEGHREINRRSRALLDELNRIEGGEHPADNQKLKYLCDRYIGYYWDHINTEEGRLFPRATAKLRQDDWFAVNAQARYVDDPLFGERVRKEYLRLAGYLARRAERITEDVAIAELFGIEALIESAAALGSALGEMRQVATAGARKSWIGTKRIAGGGTIDNGTQCALIARPGAVGSLLLRESRSAFGDIADIAKRTRSELSEPFAARMKYLRRLLREG